VAKWYFEDFELGQRIALPPIRVSPEEIVAFAREYDPQPMHIDPEAAARGHFGGLIASGWHTAALMMRSLATWFREAEVQSLGSPGVKEMRWLTPLRPDVGYAGHFEVRELRRAASRPMGIVGQSTVFADPAGTEAFRVAGIGFFACRPEARA